jgi:hypothetical protein
MKDYPIGSKIKYHFTDAVEILKVVEYTESCNKCYLCRYRKVALRHNMTGRIEEWGCRMNNIDTGCGIIGNEREDKKQIYYVKLK